MSEFDDQPHHTSTSEAVTNDVRVEVESQYVPEHSQPFQNQWLFHYTVRITNESSDTVKLLSRSKTSESGMITREPARMTCLRPG